MDFLFQNLLEVPCPPATGSSSCLHNPTFDPWKLMGHGSWVYLLFAPTRKVIPPKAQLRRISASFLYTKQLLKQSHGNGRNLSKDSPQTLTLWWEVLDSMSIPKFSPVHLPSDENTKVPWRKRAGANCWWMGESLTGHMLPSGPRSNSISAVCLENIWEHISLAFVGIQLCSKLPTGPSLQRISNNGRLNWNSACLTPSALHNHQH